MLRVESVSVYCKATVVVKVVLFCSSFVTCNLAYAGEEASRGVEANSQVVLGTAPVPDTSQAFRKLAIARDPAHAALVAATAQRLGMPAAIADAVTRVESGYDPTAISNKGAVGLMQVMPATARMLGFQGALADLFIPETNVRLGVTYLSQAWRLTDGSVCRTVLKYYAGHRAERMIPDALTYCRRVVALLDRAKFPVPQPDRDIVDGAGGPLEPGRGVQPRGRPLAVAMRSPRLRRMLPAWLTNPRMGMAEAREASVKAARGRMLPSLSIMVGN